MARTPEDMAKELDERDDIEVGGKMAEEIMAEQAGQKLPGGEETPQPDPKPTEKPEPEPQPEPAAKPAAEADPKPQTDPKPEEPPVSFLSGLDDEEEEEGGEPTPSSQKAPGVPPGMIRDIQTEREKRKAAEAQAAEYQRKLAEYEAQKAQAADVDLSDVLGEGEDDDLIDRKTLKQAIEATARKTRELTLQEIQEREAAVAAKAARQQRKQALMASEMAIRQTVKDYDAVVKAALETGAMTPDEQQSVLRAPNPAAALYRKCKGILADFGIQPTPVAAQPAATPVVPETPKEQEEPSGGDEIVDDEELYNSVFQKT